MIISTDSLENPRLENSDKIKIISIAPLFAEAVRRMQLRESISELFDGVSREMLLASLELSNK